MKIAVTLEAGAEDSYPVTGRFMVVYSASDDFEVFGVGSESIRLRQGARLDMLVGGPKKVKIKNISSASNTIDIEVTPLPVSIADNKDFTVNTTATIEVADDNAHKQKVTVTAGSSVAIAAANASRKSLRVAVPSDAAGYVSLGKSGIVADQGGLLEPGMVDYIDTTGALYARNDNADPVDVWIMEINKL